MCKQQEFFWTKKVAQLAPNDTHTWHDTVFQHVACSQLPKIGAGVTSAHTVHITESSNPGRVVVCLQECTVHIMGVDISTGCSFHIYCTVHAVCTWGRELTWHSTSWWDDTASCCLPWHRVRPRLCWFSYADSAHFLLRTFCFGPPSSKLVYSQLQQGHRCSALLWAVKLLGPWVDCISKKRKDLRSQPWPQGRYTNAIPYLPEHCTEEFSQEATRVVP